jgi:hypothetical protein
VPAERLDDVLPIRARFDDVDDHGVERRADDGLDAAAITVGDHDIVTFHREKVADGAPICTIVLDEKDAWH